jgi:diguanylate cyclase (GGDEF)-like protein
MLAYGLVSSLAIVAHLLLEWGSLEQQILYELIAAASVPAILLGVWRHRPARPLPWLLLGAAQLLFVLGDTIWLILDALGESPFPSVADIAYLAGYPALIGAFALAVRIRIRGGDRTGLLDGLILATAVFLAGWLVLIRPAIDGELDPLSLAVSVAYPVGDLLALGVVIGLLATPGARTPSFVFLIVGVTSMFVADVLYVHVAALDAYVDGGPLDVLWLVSYVTLGMAALHSSMREVAAPYPVQVAWLSRVRLGLMALAMLTGPLMVMLVGVTETTDVPVLAAGSGILSLLVLVRLSTVVDTLGRDISTRRHLERELSYRALHDPLTGLPNRRRFLEALEALLTLPDRQTLSVLYLDIDDFKGVNDSLGHAAGDLLLTAVGGRVRRHLREGDLAARLGGDEFAVLLPGVAAGDAARAATRLLAAIDEPLELEGQIVTAHASVGVVEVGERTTATAAGVLADADIAMYNAKGLGKGRVVVYAPGMRDAVVDRLQLEADLRKCLARNEMVLEYQPLIDLSTGRVVGAEALARWNHPVRGRVVPDTFIPIAEASGLIVELGDWVVRRACRQLASWRRMLDPGLALHVNLSARQLDEPALASLIEDAAGAAGLPLDALVVEVTESSLLGDAGRALANLTRLREQGVRVAIDDFGTGYSSLNYLGRLPVDMLKIDREFTDQLDHDEERSLAAVVIRMGETLGLESVAEGIERPTQLDALRRLGCRMGQGYLFAPPMSSERFETSYAVQPGASQIDGQRAEPARRLGASRAGA